MAKFANMYVLVLSVVYLLKVLQPAVGQMSCPAISEKDKVPAPQIPTFHEFWANVHANSE